MINSNEKKKSLMQTLRELFLDSDQGKENQGCGCNTPPQPTQNCGCGTPQPAQTCGCGSPPPPQDCGCGAPQPSQGCGCGSGNQVSSCCSSSVNETFNSIAQRFGKKKADSSCGCGSINTVGPEDIAKMSQEELSYYRAYEQINPKVFKNLDDLFNYKKTGKVPAPTFISIDPTNICNLKCPLCFFGQKTANYKKGVMSFNTFKTVVDKIPTLESIALFSFGESFLNPEIFDMIKYASQKDIMTSIHSNFSFKKDDEFFTNIVQSGLCSLVLSIDGASQDTYSVYRQGGDFDLLISNIRMLNSVKEQLKSETPVIIWKLMVNKYNEHEVETAKKMAEDLGILFMTDEITLCDLIPDADFGETLEKRKNDWLPKNDKYIKSIYRGEYSYPINQNSICNQLFENLIVNWDGKVFPCCWLTDENNAFGDLSKESFEDVWHGEKYQYARSMFIPRDGAPRNINNTICAACKNFKKTDTF